MSTLAPVIFWSPEVIDIPLETGTFDLYELPKPNSHIWLLGVCWFVHKIETDSDNVTVHLHRDIHWERKVLIELPNDYHVCGGQSRDNGLYRFWVRNSDGNPIVLPRARGYDLESALRGVVRETANRLGQRR